MRITSGPQHTKGLVVGFVLRVPCNECIAQIIYMDPVPFWLKGDFKTLEVRHVTGQFSIVTTCLCSIAEIDILLHYADQHTHLF